MILLSERVKILSSLIQEGLGSVPWIKFASPTGRALLLLLNSGDREPDKIGVAIGRGQYHDRTFFR